MLGLMCGWCTARGIPQAIDLNHFFLKTITNGAWKHRVGTGAYPYKNNVCNALFIVFGVGVIPLWLPGSLQFPRGCPLFTATRRPILPIQGRKR